ncbi:MAG: hypothetical protein ACP5UA_14270 [Candidatus Hydrogenedens sp.]
MAQFISFVGTQVMGTLNSALSVLNLEKSRCKFLLLHTEITAEQTDKISSQLLKQNPKLEIQNKLSLQFLI